MIFSSTSAEALTRCVGPKIGLGASCVDTLYRMRLPWNTSAFEVRIPGSHIRKAHVSLPSVPVGCGESWLLGAPGRPWSVVAIELRARLTK